MYLKADKTKGNRFKDLTDLRFGKLVVLGFDGKGGNGHSKWLCRCDCGNNAISYSTNLLRGLATSCGCHKKSVLGNSTRKHGMRFTRIFQIWVGIKKRCHNPNCSSYKWYGGRGISVCKRWRDSFENFYEDMKEGYADNLTLERENPNGNYEKGNCKWATYVEQARNKTNSVYYEIKGERKTLAEWAELSGIRANTISNRIKVGWPEEKLFDKPKRKLASLEEISMYLIF